MTSFCLLLVVVVVGVSGFDAPGLDPAIPTVSPHTSSNPDSCVGQCAFAFVDSIRSELGSVKTTSLLQLNFNDFLTSFSNSSFFEQFCGIYHSFQHCSSKCEPGYLHQLLMRSSEIVDHYCVYNFEAIRTKFPCLEKIESDKQCIQLCAPKHESVTSLMNNFRHLALSGDTTQAESYLGDSCEYVTCTLHCDIPKIANICDLDTAELVVELTRRSFQSMEKMALDTNAVNKWPHQCSDIKTYRLPTPVKPPTGQDVINESKGHAEKTVPEMAALVNNNNNNNNILKSVFSLLSLLLLF